MTPLAAAGLFLCWLCPCRVVVADHSNAVYLQDSGVTVEGLKIWGSPWNNSCNMGFSKRGIKLHEVRPGTLDGEAWYVTGQEEAEEEECLVVGGGCSPALAKREAAA